MRTESGDYLLKKMREYAFSLLFIAMENLVSFLAVIVHLYCKDNAAACAGECVCYEH